MANPHHHAVSSAKKYGGEPKDYIEIHQWFDASKAHLADFRHRALRHHSQGIFEAEKVFGDETGCITNSKGAKVPVRLIGEQHVMEDLGRIPTVADWLLEIRPREWMNKPSKLSKESAGTPAFLGPQFPMETVVKHGSATGFQVDDAVPAGLTHKAFVEGMDYIPKSHLP